MFANNIGSVPVPLWAEAEVVSGANEKKGPIFPVGSALPVRLIRRQETTKVIALPAGARVRAASNRRSRDEQR